MPMTARETQTSLHYRSNAPGTANHRDGRVADRFAPHDWLHWRVTARGPRIMHRISTTCAVISLCCVSMLRTPSAAAESVVSYDRDIRPILSDKCFRCHGPDAEARQADLRLDTREGLTDYAVVPGKPEESELVARITSDDPEVRMPPPESKLALSNEQKELLRRWVAEGVQVAEHWSFGQLPENVAVPHVKDSSWPQQTLDRFVLARLEAEGVQPTRRADAMRLLRRLTLDLTGLPPSAEECREFEKAAANNFDDAVEQAVERLLASPAFGEHMAVAWLDAARYADSYGYQSDQLNTQWPYRDWVVRALNDNLPYDKFLTWQLAGDLLENATQDQILATAFNRLHRLTNEGGSIAEEWLVENAADRIHTMGTAVLGLTIECARCHDHKYDPITMRDYYSLFAFFNSIDENGMYDHTLKVPSPSLLLPNEEQSSRLAAAERQVREAEAELASAIAEGESRFDDWLAQGAPPLAAPQSGEGEPKEPKVASDADLAAYFSFDGELGKMANEAVRKTGEGNTAGLQDVDGVRGRALRFDGDHGALFTGVFQVDRWDCFTVDFWIRDNLRNPLPVVVLQRTFGTDVGYNGFDLMLAGGILEARLYRVWPGNAIGMRAERPITAGEWQHVAVTYDGSSKAAGLRLFLNGQELATRITRDEIHKKTALATYGADQLTLGERFRDRGFKEGELDDLRIFSRAVSLLEIRNLRDGRALAAALADANKNRDELQAYYFSAIDQPAREARQKLRDARRKVAEAEEPLQEVPVMKELTEARPAYILARGAYDAAKTDENRVGRDTFSAILIPFPNDAPRNRSGLAQWLTDSRHPLTSRVAVNGIWTNFLGRPLVTTPENFGRQGAAPTHPELLDWLARDFVDHGWDIKRLCRMIALSATYQQDSRSSPHLRERDPENALLARGPSRRLSAEQIRDLALAAGGLLDRRIGGPPVSPYQPGEDLWRETNTMSPAYQQSTGRDLHRRSLYSVWKRTAPLPNMLAFDAGTREACTVSRGRTNTPLQALVLLNDVQFVEAARALATAVSQRHRDLDDQIREAFLRLTGRHPDDVELRLLSDLCRQQRAQLAANGKQDAAKFVQLGESKPGSAHDPVDLAALTITCQAILNLDAATFER
jgi:Protein of unknown function (DUF1553)/Protein of unknown function (DUF1549)/Planctomycete cytochrome C/Concanavalin A-like lectin/glucanases superfamily